MAGRMGGDRVTTINLQVVKIDSEKGELYIQGAIPGRKGTVIEIVQK
jgi:large subunit ribosomal protein L3